jgi:AcrR family transcriptional regulator
MSRHSETSLRERQAAEVRDRLLQACEDIVVRGDEPTMRGVAKEGGVSERTIYRYFPSFEELVEAAKPRFVGKSGVPLCDSADELERYAGDLFGTFEANKELIANLLTSSWVKPLMNTSRAQNLSQMRALLDEAHPRAPAKDRRAAASALRALLSGASWHYLRVSCGLGPREVVEHARWTIRSLRAALDPTS